ncbi:MAG TPA: SLC13 family permease, partial [Dongiaceae bacterium]|nr:SLC13 family permease [Dongiaceae bacterium]
MTAGAASGPARFETTLRTIGLLLGPACAVGVYLLHPGALEPPGRRLLAILAFTVVFWMTEAIPLAATALLASALAILCGVAPAREVFQPYADPVIFLFVGSFLLAEAFRKYGLDRRVAAIVVGGRGRARTPESLLASVGVATAFVSCWLSNTATAALMTPMALGIADARRRSRLTSALLLMVAYAASIGGMATLVGTPPNLLTAGYIERLAGVKVGFAAWLLFGVPLAAVLLVASIVAVRIAARAGPGDALPSGAAIDTPPAPALEAREPEPALAQRGARLTIAAFLLAGMLWMLPAIATVALGAD